MRDAFIYKVMHPQSLSGFFVVVVVFFFVVESERNVLKGRVRLLAHWHDHNYTIMNY